MPELRAYDRDSIIIKIKIGPLLGRLESLRDGLIDAIAIQSEITPDVALKKTIPLFVEQDRQLANRHSADKSAPECKTLDDKSSCQL